MTSRSRSPRYVLVSPVRDEARHIELTLRSVSNQTIRPLSWVIVDDGSVDATRDIVRGFQVMTCPFIQLIELHREGLRHAGSRVIHAFNRGHELLKDSDYDFIVKLDCDLSFRPDYFERLLGKFLTDDRLGIASGVYLELDNAAKWRAVRMPPYHAFGACKVVRRACFENIAGFITEPGWDTVDEIRAWNAGWTTGHFADLEVRHHKREGSGIGRVRTSRMHGEIFYRTGGDPLFLLLKIARRLTVTPLLIGAIAVAWGYLGALLKRQPLLVTRSEAQSYRRVLRQRLTRRSMDPAPGQPVYSRQ